MTTYESEDSPIAPFAAAATHLTDISPFGPLLTAAAAVAAHCR